MEQKQQHDYSLKLCTVNCPADLSKLNGLSVNKTGKYYIFYLYFEFYWLEIQTHSCKKCVNDKISVKQ